MHSLIRFTSRTLFLSLMKHFCALKDRTYVEMLGRVRLVGVAIAVLLCAGYSASAWGQFDSASVFGND
jgi:hypothetical protein